MQRLEIGRDQRIFGQSKGEFAKPVQAALGQATVPIGCPLRQLPRANAVRARSKITSSGVRCPVEVATGDCPDEDQLTGAAASITVRSPDTRSH